MKKKNFGNNDGDFNNLISGLPSWPSPDDDDSDWEDEGDDLECEYADMISKLIFVPKPFGMPWTLDSMTGFLKALGYVIMNRTDEDTDEDYTVAVKPETETIPEYDNIIEVFTDEVQRIILKLLLKLDKKYE